MPGAVVGEVSTSMSLDAATCWERTMRRRESSCVRSRCRSLHRLSMSSYRRTMTPLRVALSLKLLPMMRKIFSRLEMYACRI